MQMLLEDGRNAMIRDDVDSDYAGFGAMGTCKHFHRDDTVVKD